MRERTGLGVGVDERAACARAAQVALVQCRDVDVADIRLDQRRGDMLLAQHRHDGACLRGVEPAGAWRECADDGELLLERRDLVGARDTHGAARAEQRVLAEAVRRLFEERAAAPVQTSHHGIAIALEEQCRGTPGRVIAGCRFTFQHDHAAMRGQLAGRRRTGDAGTDDKEIRVLRLLHRCLALWLGEPSA